MLYRLADVSKKEINGGFSTCLFEFAVIIVFLRFSPFLLFWVVFVVPMLCVILPEYLAEGSN